MSNFSKALVDSAGMTNDAAERIGPPVLTFHPHALPGVRVECRSLSQLPPDKTVTIFYRPTKGGGFTQSGVGMFKEGAWRLMGKKGEIGADWLWSSLVPIDG